MPGDEEEINLDNKEAYMQQHKAEDFDKEMTCGQSDAGKIIDYYEKKTKKKIFHIKEGDLASMIERKELNIPIKEEKIKILQLKDNFRVLPDVIYFNTIFENEGIKTLQLGISVLTYMRDEGEELVYLHKNCLFDEKTVAHTELFIVYKNKIIKPIHWGDRVGGRAQIRYFNFLGQKDDFYASVEHIRQFVYVGDNNVQDLIPQKDHYSCLTLSLSCAKELIKNDYYQLENYTLCVPFHYNCKRFGYLFIPSPQILKYSQSGLYNEIFKCFVTADTADIKFTYKGGKHYTIKPLGKVIEESIEKAQEPEKAMYLKELIEIQKNLKVFCKKWQEEYVNSNKKRQLMQGESNNFYLTYKGLRAKKIIAGWEPPDKPNKKIMQVSIAENQVEAEIIREENQIQNAPIMPEEIISNLEDKVISQSKEEQSANNEKQQELEQINVNEKEECVEWNDIKGSGVALNLSNQVQVSKNSYKLLRASTENGPDFLIENQVQAAINQENNQIQAVFNINKEKQSVNNTEQINVNENNLDGDIAVKDFDDKKEINLDNKVAYMQQYNADDFNKEMSCSQSDVAKIIDYYEKKNKKEIFHFKKEDFILQSEEAERNVIVDKQEIKTLQLKDGFSIQLNADDISILPKKEHSKILELGIKLLRHVADAGEEFIYLDKSYPHKDAPGHVELFIVRGKKIIKPIFWGIMAQMDDYHFSEQEGIFATVEHIKLFVDEGQGEKYFCPQKDDYSCLTLSLSCAKELIKNDYHQLKNYTLCVPIRPYYLDKFRYLFIPSPQILKYSQSGLYNEIFKCFVTADTADIKFTYKGGKHYTIKPLGKVIEESIEKAQEPEKAMYLKELIEIQKNLKVFCKKWQEEYVNSNKKRQLMQGESNNFYLTYKGLRAKKIIAGWEPPDKPNKKIMQVSIEEKLQNNEKQQDLEQMNVNEKEECVEWNDIKGSGVALNLSNQVSENGSENGSESSCISSETIIILNGDTMINVKEIASKQSNEDSLKQKYINFVNKTINNIQNNIDRNCPFGKTSKINLLQGLLVNLSDKNVQFNSENCLNELEKICSIKRNPLGIFAAKSYSEFLDFKKSLSPGHEQEQESSIQKTR